MELLNYKGYHGSVETAIEDGVLHGKILFINDLVTYEAETLRDLRSEFEAAVADYVETCQAIGKNPEKPCSGQFNVRIDPELHKRAALRAIQLDQSLNAIVVAALEKYLDEQDIVHNHHHDHDVRVTVKLEQNAVSVAASQGMHFITPIHEQDQNTVTH